MKQYKTRIGLASTSHKKTFVQQSVYLNNLNAKCDILNILSANTL